MMTQQSILSGQRVFPKPLNPVDEVSRNSCVLSQRLSGLHNNILTRPWSEDEDQTIISFVQVNGERSWSKVSRIIKRTASECRDRWNLCLRPNLMWHQRQVDAEITKRGRQSLNRTAILQKNRLRAFGLGSSYQSLCSNGGRSFGLMLGFGGLTPGRIIANAAAATILAGVNTRQTGGSHFPTRQNHINNSSIINPQSRARSASASSSFIEDQLVIEDSDFNSSISKTTENDGIQRSWLDESYLLVGSNIQCEKLEAQDSSLSGMPILSRKRHVIPENLIKKENYVDNSIRTKNNQYELSQDLFDLINVSEEGYQPNNESKFTSMSPLHIATNFDTKIEPSTTNAPHQFWNPLSSPNSLFFEEVDEEGANSASIEVESPNFHLVDRQINPIIKTKEAECLEDSEQKTSQELHELFLQSINECQQLLFSPTPSLSGMELDSCTAIVPPTDDSLDRILRSASPTSSAGLLPGIGAGENDENRPMGASLGELGASAHSTPVVRLISTNQPGDAGSSSLNAKKTRTRLIVRPRIALGEIRNSHC